jgi:hypothetical protein
MYPSIDIVELPLKLSQVAEFVFLDNKEVLYPHQEFVRRYLSIYTPYKEVIVFHTVGSGKSLMCMLHTII